MPVVQMTKQFQAGSMTGSDMKTTNVCESSGIVQGDCGNDVDVDGDDVDGDDGVADEEQDC